MTDKNTTDLSSPSSIHNIVGVDIVDSCIQDARENALLNGQSNCTYITGICEDQKTLDSLTALINQNADRYDTKVYLIVDPARDGLHRKVRRFIKTFRFDGFIYCSCNVKTWETDIVDILQDVKLRPIVSSIIDMFPHTQHYEVVSGFITE